MNIISMEPPNLVHNLANKKDRGSRSIEQIILTAEL